MADHSVGSDAVRRRSSGSGNGVRSSRFLQLLRDPTHRDSITSVELDPSLDGTQPKLTHEALKNHSMKWHIIEQKAIRRGEATQKQSPIGAASQRSSIGAGSSSNQSNALPNRSYAAWEMLKRKQQRDKQRRQGSLTGSTTNSVEFAKTTSVVPPQAGRAREADDYVPEIEAVSLAETLGRARTSSGAASQVDYRLRHEQHHNQHHRKLHTRPSRRDLLADDASYDDKTVSDVDMNETNYARRHRESGSMGGSGGDISPTPSAGNQQAQSSVRLVNGGGEERISESDGKKGRLLAGLFGEVDEDDGDLSDDMPTPNQYGNAHLGANPPHKGGTTSLKMASKSPTHEPQTLHQALGDSIPSPSSLTPGGSKKASDSKRDIKDALTSGPVSDLEILESARGHRDDDPEQADEEEEDDDDDEEGSESGRSASESDESEAEGEFKGKKGDFLTSRYRVHDEVGKGTFGRVLDCVDTKTGKRVAVKVVHDAGRYYELSLIEAEILRDVNAMGGNGVSHCVMLLNFFKHDGHACMVFETLGLSLYEFLKSNDYIPFPLYCVQEFSKQMLEAIGFLHSIKLIHTDLKPENVLLVSSRFKVQQVGRKQVRIPEDTRIKLIDFGCATYDDDEHKSELIATRQYRAPEVILGLPWSFASDIWSIGCIVAELYSGDQLFETHNNMEHLALIERGVGRFPKDMLQHSETADKYFDLRNGLSLWRTALDAEGRRHVRGMKTLEAFVGEDKDTGLLSFFDALLDIDPDERITAEDALQKSFVAKAKSRLSDKSAK